MKPRRHRADSVAEAVRIVRNAHRAIAPPPNVPLSQVDRQYFNNIISEWALAAWSPHQIELAAMLARSMNDFATEQALLREEGAVIAGGTGGQIPNPRKHVIALHASNILGLRRSLALHAAGAGKFEDHAKRARIAKQIESESGLADGLISRSH